MHGVDDFGVVDALQVDRSDPEVGVSQLALDDNQRNPLPSHLDRMGMSKLVWREAAAHARARGDPPQLWANSSRKPPAPAGRSVDDAEQRAHRKRGSDLEPGPELVPS